MNGFLQDSERFWGDEPPKPANKSENIPKMLDGRYVLAKWKCPVCGERTCTIKKKSHTGFPMVYCKTMKFYVECVYLYI
jgi:hypothetical protein